MANSAANDFDVTSHTEVEYCVKYSGVIWVFLVYDSFSCINVRSFWVSQVTKARLQIHMQTIITTFHMTCSTNSDSYSISPIMIPEFVTFILDCIFILYNFSSPLRDSCSRLTIQSFAYYLQSRKTSGNDFSHYLPIIPKAVIESFSPLIA